MSHLQAHSNPSMMRHQSSGSSTASAPHAINSQVTHSESIIDDLGSLLPLSYLHHPNSGESLPNELNYNSTQNNQPYYETIVNPILAWSRVLYYRVTSIFKRELLPSPKLLTIERRHASQLDFDGLMESFRNGLIPNSKDLHQVKAFQIYRDLYFVNKGRAVQNDAAIFADVQQNNPNLSKHIFPDVELSVPYYTYKTPQDLNNLIEHTCKCTSTMKKILLTPLNEKAFWSGITLIEKQGERATLIDIMGSYEQLFPEPFLTNLSNPDLTIAQRLQVVYQHIKKIQIEISKRGFDSSPLSQLLVDTALLAGLGNKEIINDLKAKNPLSQIHAFRQGFAEIDEFIQIVTGKDHGLIGLMAELKVSNPTELLPPSLLNEKLDELEQQTHRTAKLQSDESKIITVRQLSLAESPYRGVLGGCCSSEYYFEKGLEPPFIYFTLTDKQGISRGQITLVLGTACDSSGPKRAAMIDKIQNIENHLLPDVLEAIRRSLATAKYTVTIPSDLGGANGISNDMETRKFICDSLKSYTKQHLVLKNFTPHYVPPELRQRNKFSRAYKHLAVKPLLESENSKIQFKLKNPTSPWMVDKINWEDVREKTVSLKYGSELEKMRYIRALTSLESVNDHPDPSFHDTLKLWISDKSMDRALRRQALEYFVLAKNDWSFEGLSHFSHTERIDLVQNWLQTPRFLNCITVSIQPFLAAVLGANAVTYDLLGRLTPDYFLSIYLQDTFDMRSVFRHFIFQHTLSSKSSNDKLPKYMQTIPFRMLVTRLERYRKTQSVASNKDTLLASFLASSDISPLEKRECLKEIVDVSVLGESPLPRLAIDINIIPESQIAAIARNTFVNCDLGKFNTSAKFWNRLMTYDFNFIERFFQSSRKATQLINAWLATPDWQENYFGRLVVEFGLKYGHFDRYHLLYLIEELNLGRANQSRLLYSNIGEHLFKQISFTLNQEDRLRLLARVKVWSDSISPKIIEACLDGATAETATTISSRYLPKFAKKNALACNAITVKLNRSRFASLAELLDREQYSRHLPLAIGTAVSQDGRLVHLIEDSDRRKFIRWQKDGITEKVVCLDDAERSALVLELSSNGDIAFITRDSRFIIINKDETRSELPKRQFAFFIDNYFSDFFIDNYFFESTPVPLPLKWLSDDRIAITSRTSASNNILERNLYKLNFYKREASFGDSGWNKEPPIAPSFFLGSHTQSFAVTHLYAQDLMILCCRKGITAIKNGNIAWFIPKHQILAHVRKLKWSNKDNPVTKIETLSNGSVLIALGGHSNRMSIFVNSEGSHEFLPFGSYSLIGDVNINGEYLLHHTPNHLHNKSGIAWMRGAKEVAFTPINFNELTFKATPLKHGKVIVYNRDKIFEINRSGKTKQIVLPIPSNACTKAAESHGIVLSDGETFVFVINYSNIFFIRDGHVKNQIVSDFKISPGAIVALPNGPVILRDKEWGAVYSLTPPRRQNFQNHHNT